MKTLAEPVRLELFILGFLGVTGCAAIAGRSAADHARLPAYDLDSVVGPASTRQFAALVGTVVDSAGGRPLWGPQVMLTSQSGTGSYLVRTDEYGGYVIGHIAPGKYQILVRNAGYIPFRAEREMRAGVVDTLRVRLKKSLLDTSQAVEGG